MRVPIAVLGRDAVFGGTARDRLDVGAEAGVVRRQRSLAHGGVRVVVRIERLGRRLRLTDVSRSSSLLSLVLETEVGRDGDRKQNADDDQNNKELDEREAALVLVDPLPEG